MATNPIELYSAYTNLPFNLIKEEVTGIYGSELLAELGSIIKLYKVYEEGASFLTEGTNGDYVPSNLRYRQSAKLINKEARFLFSKSPDVYVKVPYATTNSAAKEIAKAQTTILQQLVDNVIEKNNFFAKLVKAAKDCFIGKRVAYFVNFNEETQKIRITFIPSLEFVYETDEEDSDRLTKIVTFYTIKDSEQKTQQRVYKKKYWLADDGLCWIFEAIYDGRGVLIEELTPNRATKFTYIPAGVILNDGLTGDTKGESEIDSLVDYEAWYSRLGNADIDAERKGMNPVRYTIDMNPTTTEGLSTSPGSFWDLASDQTTTQDGVTGQVGVLESSMGYSPALATTIDRIKSNMFEQIDMPDISPEALKGVVSSGKTLKAIYWGLIVRCDEKMLAWRPALKHIVQCIIDGSRLYPLSAQPYIKESLPDVEYDITVNNQYPLPEDEAEEKGIDLAEVGNMTMSKKAYMIKWRNLTDEEADQELQQIALEKELLENSMGGMPPTEEEDIEEEPEEPEPPDEEEDDLLAELDRMEAEL